MTGPVSRRAMLGGALAAGVAVALPRSRAAARLVPERRSVAVFGAGMAGLAAAHELAERGFAVHVFERKAQLGGKARSFGVPGTATGGRSELPAEHGFRFFPGFYQHVPDSMSRIPRPERGDTTLDSLRGLDEFPGFGGGVTLGPGQSVGGYLPYRQPADLARLADPAYLVANVAGALAILVGTPTLRLPVEMLDFTAKSLAYMTSSPERRHGPFDHITWWNYLGADGKSTYFQNAIVKGTTEDLVAVKPRICAVDSAGNIIEAFTWNILGYRYGPHDAYLLRFLDGPTSEVWLDPWTRHLEGLGVSFHPGQALERFDVAGDRITGATVVDGAGRRARVEADWFVSALPVDKARPILTEPAVLRADPALEGVNELTVDWMNGLQIYLREPTSHVRGVLGTLDHPWTLSAVTQSLLWREDFPRRFGDGTVGECVSVDISTWDNGVGTTLVGKPANRCARDEVFQEVWATFKARFGAEEPAFRDANLHSWYLDPAIDVDPETGGLSNDEPLTVQTVGTWDKRPDGSTALSNLFVCGDWIQNPGNVACMEAGNIAGRVVAAMIVEAAGVGGAPVRIWDDLTPPALAPLIRMDADRFRHGLPNIFEDPTTALAGIDFAATVSAAVDNAIGTP
ncbi:hydroxysqualene dehydroxylase [Nocardia sp. NPDC003482]